VTVGICIGRTTIALSVFSLHEFGFLRNRT
jgi:hypothetical protein